MVLTKKGLVDMLMRYINRDIDLSTLVGWAEDMIMKADFEEKDFELTRDIMGHIGLADVREFGLTWDDCYEYLHKLGYDIKIELTQTIK